MLNLAVLMLALFSLSVWAGIAMRWQKGRPALACLPRNSSPWLPFAAAGAGAYIAVMLVLSVIVLLRNSAATPILELSDIQGSVIDGVIAITIALLLLTGAGRVPLSECGLHLRQSIRQLRDGWLGYLASLTPVFLLLMATASLRTAENQHPFLKLLDANRTPETIAWLLMTAVVVAPLKEELLFRVMLQDGLARQIGSAPAIGIVSVLFCAVHGFPDSLALLPLAVILGYVYDRRQSVISVVIIHALFNLTNIGILLLEPDLPQ